MYGAKLSRPVGGFAQPLGHRIGTNSEVFAIGDLVDITSGFLEVQDHVTADRIIGICKIAKTMESDNQTVDKYEVPYIKLSIDDEFEMDFDDDAAEANVGQFFQLLTAGTGAQQVDFSTASDTVGQVVLKKLDPRGEGSVVRGLFSIALPELAFEPET